MTKSDADIMHESREYIAVHGWTQGTMVDIEGRVCGYGAVAKSQGWFVMDEDTRCQPTCRRILAKVLVAIGHAPRDTPLSPLRPLVGEAELELSDFTTWNDDYAESQQQVEDAFAKAEKIERAGFDPDA